MRMLREPCNHNSSHVPALLLSLLFAFSCLRADYHPCRFDKDTPASKAGSDPAKKERAELEGRVTLLKVGGVVQHQHKHQHCRRRCQPGTN